MSFVDPIGDMITRIRNAQMRSLSNVKIPSSKFRAKISEVLKQEGYIADYKNLSDEKNKNNDMTDDGTVKVIDEPINETIYRVQIGASFKKPLSDAVFAGVDNVVSFTGKDGFIRYMVGSFTEYKDALDYQAQMKARGFEDAFIVTYKNGKRISLNVVIKAKNTNSVVKEKEFNEVVLDLKFTDLAKDTEVISNTRLLAKQIISNDPSLTKPKNKSLFLFIKNNKKNNVNWSRIS